MGQRLLDQCVDGDVVLYITLFIQDAILPVGGERVQRHVGDHPKLGETLAQGAGCALGNAFRVPGLGGVQGLEPGRRDREQRQRRDPQFNPLRRLFEQQINGQALDTRHRRHRFPAIFAIEHKHRQDQIIHRQYVFTDQAARKIITTVAAQAGSGKQALGGGKAHGRLLSPA
jgi:hypothetical protein